MLLKTDSELIKRAKKLNIPVESLQNEVDINSGVVSAGDIIRHIKFSLKYFCLIRFNINDFNDTYQYYLKFKDGKIKYSKTFKSIEDFYNDLIENLLDMYENQLVRRSGRTTRIINEGVEKLFKYGRILIPNQDCNEEHKELLSYAKDIVVDHTGLKEENEKIYNTILERLKDCRDIVETKNDGSYLIIKLIK